MKDIESQRRIMIIVVLFLVIVLLGYVNKGKNNKDVGNNTNSNNSQEFIFDSVNEQNEFEFDTTNDNSEDEYINQADEKDEEAIAKWLGEESPKSEKSEKKEKEDNNNENLIENTNEDYRENSKDSEFETNLNDENISDEEINGENKGLCFRNDQLLRQHFNKHGADMGFATKEEYEAAASAVVSNPNALHKIEAEDGDDVYYVEETNEFVIVSGDGYLRTYFYPGDGIDYFNRQ